MRGHARRTLLKVWSQGLHRHIGCYVWNCSIDLHLMRNSRVPLAAVPSKPGSGILAQQKLPEGEPFCRSVSWTSAVHSLLLKAINVEVPVLDQSPEHHNCFPAVQSQSNLRWLRRQRTQGYYLPRHSFSWGRGRGTRLF